jgi:DNA-binding SARP family transcriptional activator
MSAASLEIDVLGPVAVQGAMQPFRRSAALELVVFLAFHRVGAQNADWPIALWPDRAISPPTIHSTASDARRALGRTTDGRDRLCHGGRIKLSDDVRTDVEEFERLASFETPDHLVAALKLIRGPIFSGLRRTDWAVLDGTQARIEALVAGAAMRAAEALSAAGRAHQAEWAVRRGLVVSPYDERLYRALLRTTAAQGNRVGLRATMAQLLVLAGASEGVHRLSGSSRRGRAALDLVHPETADLFRELIDGPPASGGISSRL